MRPTDESSWKLCANLTLQQNLPYRILSESNKKVITILQRWHLATGCYFSIDSYMTGESNFHRRTRFQQII